MKMILVATTLFFFLAASVTKALETNHSSWYDSYDLIHDGTFNQSLPEDKKQFRRVVLQNGMKILLISRPDIEKSAAELHIKVGPVNDPPHLQGMAELLSRVVYYKIIPGDEQDSLAYYLPIHGGSKSVWNFLESTYHFFQIDADYFLKSVELFTQSFTTAPIFRPTSVESVLSVIKSEHERENRVEIVRLKAIEKMPIDPEHPIRKISCKTDKLNSIYEATKANLSLVEKELKKFYKKFYAANRMTLIVYGKESLDELSKMVVPVFAKMKKVKTVDRKIEPIYSPHPYASPDHSGYKLKFLASTYADNVLSVYFALPEFSEKCHEFVPEYLLKFFNSKRPGGLISTLVSKNLAKSALLFQVQYNIILRGAGQLRFQINLTPRGASMVEQVLYEIFAYAKYLKSTPVQWQVLDQMRRNQKVDELNMWHHVEVVYSYSFLMDDRGIEQIFDTDCKMTNSQIEGQIIHTLSYLRPDNLNYLIGSRNFTGQTDQVEECTGAEYSMEKITQEELNYFSTATLDKSTVLILTAKNFSNENFTYVSHLLNKTDVQKYPSLLYEDENKRLWWFNYAHATYAFFTFKIPSSHGYLLALLKDVLSHEAAEHFRGVESDGYYFSFYPNERGFAIRTTYPWKDLPNFLAKTFEIFAKNRSDPAIFLNAKKTQIEYLVSISNGQPIHIADRYMQQILESPVSPHSQVLKEFLEALSIDEFDNFRSNAFSRMFVEAMFYGYKEEKDHAILSFHKTVEEITAVTHSKSLDPTVPNFQQAVKLPNGSNFIYEKIIPNQLETAVMVCFQSRAFDDRDFLTAELLQYIIKPKCENQMKTTEGLGDQVICKSSKTFSSNKFCISIQGHHNATFIDSRIEALTLDFKDYLHSIKPEIFDEIKKSFLIGYIKKFQDNRVLFWSDITRGECFFNMDEEYMKILQNITLNDVASYTERVFDKRSPERKKLAIYLHATSLSLNNVHESNEKTYIHDANKFKETMDLYPPITPRIPLKFPY